MRYHEALGEKPDAPEATFKLARALDKLGDKEGARCAYQDFLRVGSNSPLAGEAQKAIKRLESSGDKPCVAVTRNVR